MCQIIFFLWVFAFFLHEDLYIYLWPFFAFYLFPLEKDFDIFHVLCFGVFLCVFDYIYLRFAIYKKKIINKKRYSLVPANIRLDEDVWKRSWRHLSSLPSEDVLKTPSRRRLDQDQYIRLGQTSSRRLQDVFKTSLKSIQDVLPRHLQDIFKTSLRLPLNVFQTSSRRLARMPSRYFEDASSG